MTGPRDTLRTEKRRIPIQDPAQPEFVAEAHRQGVLLRGRREETQALTFIEAALDWRDP